MSRSACVVLLLGCVSAFFAVALGAVGTHALAGQFVDGGSERFRTAHDYHAFHSLALLASGLMLDRLTARRAVLTAALLLLLGIVMFSGVLYLRAVGVGNALAPLVPWGGTAWLLAWLVLSSGLVRELYARR